MRLISILILAFALGPMQAIADIADVSELRKLKEELWPQAYRDNDVELLGQILHPDFHMISASGAISTRVEELAHLPQSVWPHDEFQFDIRRLDIYHDNTAIISGQGRASGSNSDGRYCFTYQSSNFLIRHDGRWRAIASHVSGVQQGCQ